MTNYYHLVNFFVDTYILNTINFKTCNLIVTNVKVFEICINHFDIKSNYCCHLVHCRIK